MTRGLVVTAAGIVVLAALAVFLLREGTTMSSGDGSAAAARTESAPAAALHAEHDAAPREATEPAGEQAERTVVAATPAVSEVPTSDRLRVRVVDGKDGAPVAGATVWIGAQPSLDQPMAVARDTASVVAAMVTACAGLPGVATDAAGFAPLPLAAGDTLFVLAADAAKVEAAGRIGWRTMARDALLRAGVVEVTIDTGAGVVLRVHSEQGKPSAGVPLALVLPTSAGPALLWRGATGRDGAVRVANVVPLARARGRGIPLADLRLVAFVDAPLGKRPRAEFPPSALPGSPVDLVLPATGSLRVDLDRTRAAPVTECTVRVDEVGLPPEEQLLATWNPIPMVDGTALFPLVGLNLKLEVSVQVAGASVPRVLEVDGPVGAGEERRVVVTLVGDESVLVVRLLDPEGKPLPGQRIGVKLSARTGASSSTMSTELVSDANARLRITQTDRHGAGAARELELRHEPLDLTVELPVPRPWPPGETDLGDVRLERAPLLVSGQVIDAAARPIGGADVDVPEVEGARVRTGEDGRFVLRTRAAVADAMLHVKARGFQACDPIPIVPGTADLVVRLAAGGVIEGEVLLDRFDTRIHLTVMTRERRDGARQRQQVAGSSFALEHVPPGRHDVTLHLAGFAPPVARMDDVAVTPGEVTKLPALVLRGVLRQVAFTVVDENGAPVREASALVASNVAPDGEPRFEGVLVEGGHGRLVTGKGDPDLLVFADDRRAVFVPAVQDGQQITLPPAAVVIVQVPAAVLPAPPLQLRVELESTDDRFPRTAGYMLRGGNSSMSTTGSLPWTGGQLALVDASGRAQLSVATSGPHRLRCWVARRTAEGDRQAEVAGVTPSELTVPIDGGKQTVGLQLTADMMARAAARL